MARFHSTGARILAALVALVAAGAGHAILHDTVAAQMPPGVERDPDAARISYDDLDRFAAAYRRMPAIRDTAALLDSAYLAPATPGLQRYARLYDVTGASMVRAMQARPAVFRRAALAAPVEVRALEGRVRATLHRLDQLYPAALFPTIHFLVGPNRAGGTVEREGVMIAVETYARGLEELVHLVAHELTHFQQAAHDLPRYQAANTLLARAIKEGVADYVAELLTGAHINPAAHAYGGAHEWELWRRFRCEMHGTATSDWFFTQPSDPAWPRDLGYYIGYRIATLRYAREPDPAAALRALLQVDDYAAFLTESGYEAWLEGREGRAFGECRRH